jgi:hypothetical protein
MKIRWKYNRFGHVEVWDESKQMPREADVYVQTEEDVNAFFDSIGMSIVEVNIDDWDYAEIEPEWFEDDYLQKHKGE